MVYEYICPKCEYGFEKNQPMMAEHKASCPRCGNVTIRQYSLFDWRDGDVAFRRDGSYREDKDYAPVMRG